MWDQLPESTDATGERLRSPWDSFHDTLNNFESHEDLWQFAVDLFGILWFSSPVCVTGNVSSFENVSSLVSIQDDYSDQVNCNSRKQNSSRQNTIGEEQNRSTCEPQRACVCLNILSKLVFVWLLLTFWSLFLDLDCKTPTDPSCGSVFAMDELRSIVITRSSYVNVTHVNDTSRNLFNWAEDILSNRHQRVREKELPINLRGTEKVFSRELITGCEWRNEVFLGECYWISWH